LYYKKGTTLGYELLGMRIVSEETGEKKTEWPMAGRWGLKTFIAGIPVIGILFIGHKIANSDKKQGPHDLALGTIVVMEEAGKRTWAVWAANVIPVVIFLVVMYMAIGLRASTETNIIF
jgi:uncharacterized RDD family membrane protein YckC